MQPIRFTRVQNNEAAIQAAAPGSSAKYIGGGTNLIDLMKLGIENPRKLVDINSLGLQQVEPLAGGGLRIGALVRNSDLAYHAAVQENYPVLSQALLSGASPQLRNMATTGGNLLQRTRCPYFYDTAFACNKRLPGSGCAAIKGYNRTNAILGGSDKCIATHPSDMCVALAALGAAVGVQGLAGARSIPFADFHLLPGDTPEKETALAPGELITSVEIPALPFAKRSVYLKVRDRASFDFAIASAAVALDIENGTIREARIALGGIGTKPWRSSLAEKILTGAKAGKEAYRQAAGEALKNARAYNDNAFKIELSKRVLVRALAMAAAI